MDPSTLDHEPTSPRLPRLAVRCLAGALILAMHAMSGPIEPFGAPESSSASAQPAAPEVGALEMIGQYGGEINDIAWDGDVAYAAVGPRVLVIDARDVSSLETLGRTEVLSGIAHRIATRGCHVITLFDRNGFAVIDACDPTAPHVAAEIDVDVSSMEIDGDRLFLTGPEGLHVFDITDVRRPVEVAGFDIAASLNEVVVSGGIMFALGTPVDSRDHHLLLYDVSDPDSIVEIARRPVTHMYSYLNPWPRNLVKGSPGEAFMAGRFEVLERPSLWRINASDPSAVDFALVDGAPADFSPVHGRTAESIYFVGDRELFRLDYTDPAEALVPVGGKPNDTWSAIAVRGSDVLVAEPTSGLIGARFDGVRLEERGRLHVASSPFAMDLADEHAFTLSLNDTMEAIDISDPTAPRPVGSLKLPSRSALSSVNDIVIRGEHAFLASDFIDVVDVSDPTALAMRTPPTRFAVSSVLFQIDVLDNRLVGLDREGLIHLFNAADVDRLRRLDEIFVVGPADHDCGPTRIVAHGDLIGAAAGKGWAILQLGPGIVPHGVETGVSDSCVMDVMISEHAFFVIDEWGKDLKAWRLNEVGRPTALWSLRDHYASTGGYLIGGDVEGARLVTIGIESGSNAFRVSQYDVWDLTRPRLIAEAIVPRRWGQPYDKEVRVRDGLIHVIDGRWGHMIFRPRDVVRSFLSFLPTVSRTVLD